MAAGDPPSFDQPRFETTVDEFKTAVGDFGTHAGTVDSAATRIGTAAGEIDTAATAFSDAAAALGPIVAGNTVALDKNTDAANQVATKLSDHTDEMRNHRKAVEDNTKALKTAPAASAATAPASVASPFGGGVRRAGPLSPADRRAGLVRAGQAITSAPGYQAPTKPSWFGRTTKAGAATVASPVQTAVHNSVVGVLFEGARNALAIFMHPRGGRGRRHRIPGNSYK